jgi:hypothetical protein
MQYQVTDVTWVNAPKKSAADPTILEVAVNVTTGVVGDTYGFVKVDTMTCSFADSLTGVQIEASVLSQAAAFSASKYPNT